MRWEKGQSGNPKGRLKNNQELKYLAQIHSAEAIERLVYWMRSDEGRTSVVAAGMLLDRGYGKAEQLLEVKKANPFDGLTADDVLKLRDNLLARRDRAMVTLDSEGSELKEARTLQTIQETT